MKKQLLGLLGAAATVAVVQAATTPCADSTVVDIISTNMTRGMALMANATAQIQSSCNGTEISCSVDDTDVVSILSDLYSGIGYFRNAILQYYFYTQVIPAPCEVDPVPCNCPQIPTDWTAIESFYNSTYLPKWNEFALGNVSNCTATAHELFAQANQIYCDSVKIAANYEACRFDCALPCYGEAFALQVSTTINAAFALVDGAFNANEASCESDTYSCSASNTYQTIQDLEAASELFTNVLNDLERLYNGNYFAVCSLDPGQCNCLLNQEQYASIGQRRNQVSILLSLAASGNSTNCGDDVQTLYEAIFSINCNTQQLILNYNECLKECSCAPSSTQTGITESMNQALSSIDNVWSAYNAQCPGRFNCSSTNLTLVQEDLTQAVASYDLAIGNYTEFIQDTDFNTTCSLLNPSCSCRVISDQLITLNATYYLDYLPVWEDFIAGLTPNCTAQAELLRNLVLQQKCIAEQLNVDYGKCYENCQTNWCLYYNCSNKPCGSGAVWTPPPRSRWLRYAQLY